MASLASDVSKRVISAISTKHSATKVAHPTNKMIAQRAPPGLRQAVDLALSELLKMASLAKDASSNALSVISTSIKNIVSRNKD